LIRSAVNKLPAGVINRWSPAGALLLKSLKMKLHPANVANYLINAGLCTADTLQAELDSIEDRSSNNNVFLVNLAGRRLVVKQPRRLEPLQPQLRSEGTFYWLTARQPPFDSLQPYVPGYLLYDGRSDVLVVDSRPNLKGLDSLDAGTPQWGSALQAAGNALACLHRLTPDAFSAEVLALFSVTQPDVFYLLEQGDIRNRYYAERAPQLVAQAYAASELAQTLKSLRSQWRTQCLIHRDIRIGNVLVRAEDARECILIDWELACLGDPDWDVACLLESLAVRSCRQDRELFEDAFLSKAEIFLQAYQARAGRGLSAWDLCGLLAAKVLHSAFEHHQAMGGMTDSVSRLIDRAVLIVDQRRTLALALAGMDRNV
jgi:aminoglycoside phosphotransferase (APT) family kinase protein